MEFTLNEEHRLVQSTVREWATTRLLPLAAEMDRSGAYPRDLIRELGEMGLTGVFVPEEYGGGGMDTMSYCIVLEEIARAEAALAAVVSVNNSLVCFPLVAFGTEAQKRAYLPGIIRGETVCALGITEPGAGSDMAAVATRAVRAGDHYALTGAKTFITNGVHADLYFVAARTGAASSARRHDGLSMFLVERGLPGFRVGRALDKMGMRASDTAELVLDECPVPARNLLGAEGRGFQQLAAGLQRERILAAVLALSGAAQALEDTIAYLQTRHAFGGPLADKQALRHRVADMATEIEAARQLVYRAAALHAAGDECVAAVSMAKLFATEAANRVAYHAVQLHGGYGYMRELPVERFFRDVRLWTIASGTSEMMREIIARRLPL